MIIKVTKTRDCAPCLGSDLVKVLAKTALSKHDASAWRRDILAARKALKPPPDKWK